PPPPPASEATLPPSVERRDTYIIERSGRRVCVYNTVTQVGYGYCGRRPPRGPWTRIEVTEVSGALDAAAANQGVVQNRDALRACWREGSTVEVEIALLIGTLGAPLSTSPMAEGETAACMAAALYAAARFPQAMAKTRVKVRLRRTD